MKPITVYTMERCPYCVRAKQLLDRRGYKYTEHKVDVNDVAKWDELERRTGLKTMPQIFIGDKCVGGCTDLEALNAQGKLKGLVEG